MQRIVRTELDAWARPAEQLVYREAIRAVLGALLSARVTFDDLPPIEGKQLGVSVYGALLDAMKHTLRPVELAMQLREQGYWAGVSELIADLTLLPCEPGLSLPDLVAAVLKIHELYVQRTLGTQLQRVAALVLAGGITADESRRQLREVYREVLG